MTPWRAHWRGIPLPAFCYAPLLCRVLPLHEPNGHPNVGGNDPRPTRKHCASRVKVCKQCAEPSSSSNSRVTTGTDSD